MTLCSEAETSSDDQPPEREHILFSLSARVQPLRDARASLTDRIFKNKKTVGLFFFFFCVSPRPALYFYRVKVGVELLPVCVCVWMKNK